MACLGWKAGFQRFIHAITAVNTSVVQVVINLSISSFGLQFVKAQTDYKPVYKVSLQSSLLL